MILQVARYRIQLDQGVADRGSRGKDRSPVACDFIQIAALHKKVGRFLRLCLSDTAHIPHFCVEIEILVVVRLVNKETVYTEFFKGYDIILS